MSNTFIKFSDKLANDRYLIPLFLAIVCLLLHYSALDGGWRYDDGPHLYFTAKYSPWEYFFFPEIMREQSWANFTPWNAFFYEIGLPFFGLNPTGHYAHLFLILTGTSIATFYLLKLWLPPLQALFGACLYLAMPTTGAIGQMLMTGHYAYGLLFSILALYFFVLALRENAISKALLSACFYLLACWCKELFVPIIGLLILLPENAIRKRIIYAFPSLLCALFYTGYRLTVFQGVGGYGIQTQTGTIEITDIIARFNTTLFGELWLSYAVLAFMITATVSGLIASRLRFCWRLLSGGLVIIFFPILVMILSGDIGNALNIRLLYFIGWSLAVALTWLAYNNFFRGLLILVTVCFFLTQQQTIKAVAGDQMPTEAINTFLIDGDEYGYVIPYSFRLSSYFTDIKKAIELIENKATPKILESEEDIANLTAIQKKNTYQYNPSCQCMKKLDEKTLRERTSLFRNQLEAGKNESLDVFLKITNQGFRKLLTWQLEGPPGQFSLYVPGFTHIDLPRSGEFNFAATGFLNRKQEIAIYFHLNTPEGGIVRTPLLSINPAINNQVTWQGKSALNW